MQASRYFEIDHTRAKSDGRYPVVLSTETPIEREDYIGGMGIYTEIIEHTEGSVDLSRAPLPLMEGHKNAPVNVGIVEGVHVAQRKLRGFIHMGTTPRARELKADIDKGIIRNVSIGYEILKFKRNDQTIRVTRWQPMELSLVGVPADQNSGINRSKNMETKVVEEEQKTRSERRHENRETSAERERVSQILAAADRGQNAVPEAIGIAQRAIDDGISLDEFHGIMLRAMNEKSARTYTPSAADTSYMESSGGRDYSILRALRALVDPKAASDAGFEIECSQEMVRQRGRKTDGILVPLGIQSRAVQKLGSGTNLIPTEHLAGSFIDVLRAKSILLGLPITRIDGAQGDLSIPRQTGSATAQWIAGDGGDSLTETDPTFDAVTLSPTTVGGLTQFSRKMLLQSSPTVEQLVMADLAAIIATALDIQSINGDGTANKPTGILNVAGIGSVAMGTNGLALADLDKVIDLESALSNVNADQGALAYLTNSKVIAALKKLKTTTGEYLWTNGAKGDYPSGTLGNINGIGVASSNSVPSNLTKGTGSNLSAMIIGNWADLIVATWGTLEIMANPYGATDFAAGNVAVRAMMDLDVAVRHPESFAAIKDIIA